MLAEATSPSLSAPDSYLTNGHELFRVDRVLPEYGDEQLVLLENCRTLDFVLCPAEKMAEAGMRQVRGGEE